jgi:anti-anti-sigma factor
MTSTSSSRTPSESVLCAPEGNGFRIDLSGEIDLIARPRLNQVIDHITAAEPGEIFVDLTGVSFLGSEALSFFAALHGHVGPEYRVILHGPNRSARRSLELTGFDQVLTITAADEPRPAPITSPAQTSH